MVSSTEHFHGFLGRKLYIVHEISQTFLQSIRESLNDRWIKRYISCWNAFYESADSDSHELATLSSEETILFYFGNQIQNIGQNFFIDQFKIIFFLYRFISGLEFTHVFTRLD